jgi:hypothetical protein
VRLPNGFPLGPATIQLSNPSGPSFSNVFPITVTATPAAPVITNVFNSDFIATPTVNSTETIHVQADGIDTLGSVVRFQQGETITDVPSGTAISGATIGFTVQVTAPSGLQAGPISVSIRQGNGPFSAAVSLLVPAALYE